MWCLSIIYEGSELRSLTRIIPSLYKQTNNTIRFHYYWKRNLNIWDYNHCGIQLLETSLVLPLHVLSQYINKRDGGLRGTLKGLCERYHDRDRSWKLSRDEKAEWKISWQSYFSRHPRLRQCMSSATCAPQGSLCKRDKQDDGPGAGCLTGHILH